MAAESQVEEASPSPSVLSQGQEAAMPETSLLVTARDLEHVRDNPKAKQPLPFQLVKSTKCASLATSAPYSLKGRMLARRLTTRWSRPGQPGS
jgi:hypothetical protein